MNCISEGSTPRLPPLPFLTAVSCSQHFSTVMPVEIALYELLGVAPDATEDEIKKAYRRKAREHHPNPDDPTAAAKFQEMAAAYEILSSAESRELYDRFGMDGVSGPGRRSGGPQFDPNDILAELFGGGFGFGFNFGPDMRPRRTKGENTTIPYDVTLEDLYNGKSVKMNMEKEIVCGLCKGSGAKGNAKPKPCIKCEGKGWTFIQSQLAPGQLGTSRARCSECKGEGEKLREKDRCKKCKGNKTVKEKTRQEIHIDRGMHDKQRIVLTGAGDEEPGIPPGDVIFVLKCKPHPSFERSGNDLLTTVHITLSEALLGFSRILLTHLDGRGIHVSSPKGKIIKPGDSIVLRGEGMPHYKNPDQKGHLYVIMEVDMPDEEWLKTVDTKTLEALLPPKKPEMDPKPAVIDEVPFEESDIVDARETPSGASNFFEHGFANHYGDGDDEDEWSDEDDDDMGPHMEPECRQQ
ncbi:DnaJ-domain-containing protein [Panus rudis PR-1116 ss-1]|nr:DnaJ-domain-containing protein [Panus rudis PR-1116 ss-1]